MQHLDDPWRAIACAARLRDWDTIDQVLDDRMRCGSMSVVRGREDVRIAQNGGALPPLDSPALVTIHDLSPEDRARARIKPGSKYGASSYTLPTVA